MVVCVQQTPFDNVTDSFWLRTASLALPLHHHSIKKNVNLLWVFAEFKHGIMATNKSHPLPGFGSFGQRFNKNFKKIFKNIFVLTSSENTNNYQKQTTDTWTLDSVH